MNQNYNITDSMPAFAICACDFPQKGDLVFACDRCGGVRSNKDVISQRTEDKQRLLKEVDKLQPKVSLFRDAGKTTAKIYAMAIEDIKQLINKIYE